MQAMSMTKGWLVIAALGAVLFAGCSKSSGGGGDAGDADTDTDTDTNLECAWEVMVPPGDDNVFGGTGIEFLKGCSKDQVYVKLADKGPVFELESGEWIEASVQPPEDVTLVDLVCLTDGSTLWVGSTQGPTGVVYLYNGEEWVFQDIPEDRGLRGAWAVSDDDIYAIPASAHDVGGLPVHFNGQTWSILELPDVGFDFFLVDSWASGSGDVYLVGYRANDGMALVFHYNGADWEVTDFTEQGWIFPSSIWGSGPDDVYMAIEPDHPWSPFESIVRWDGTSWETFQEWGPVEGEEKEFEYIDWIWGTSSDNIYAGAWASGVWRYSEGSWKLELDVDEELAPGVLPGALKVWGSGPDDIYGGCKGAGVIHYTCH